MAVENLRGMEVDEGHLSNKGQAVECGDVGDGFSSNSGLA